MKYVDDVIVALAKNLIRSVFAIRTGFMYVQFLLLGVVALTMGTAIIAGIFLIAKNILYPF